MGKFLCASTARNSCPTAPLVPTTATFIKICFITQGVKIEKNQIGQRETDYFGINRKKVMRTFVIISVLFFSLVLQGQVLESFDFSTDSLWAQDPSGRWGIDTTQPILGRGSLRHQYDNTEAGNDRISFPLANLEPDSGLLTFHLRVRHGYAPSSSNKWGYFLFADQPAAEMKPGGNLNGYVLGVDYSGSDDLLKLWKISAGSLSVVIQTSLNWQERVGIVKAPGLLVKRLPGGYWAVLADTGSGVYDTLGTGQDNSYRAAYYTGLSFQYSATKDRLLWLDDLQINGKFIVDTVPPMLKSISLVTHSQLLLEFSEPIQDSTGFFEMRDPLFQPDSLVISGNTCRLYYAEEFPADRELWLCFEGVLDMKGNAMLRDSVVLSYHLVKTGDILINELMADPSPEVGLPDAEYIELYNPSSWPVNLNGWQLNIGNSKWKIAETVMEPYAFLLITSPGAVSLYDVSCPVMGLISGSGSLSNGGALVVLRDQKGKIISAVNYDDSWYGQSSKQDGGWSLERIDPSCICQGEGNWRASESVSGGTPGNPNSILGMLEDTIPPKPERLAPLSDTSLLLVYSETPDSGSACNPGMYLISGGIGEPGRVLQSGPMGREFILHLPVSLQKGLLYEVVVKPGIFDCQGNTSLQEYSLPLAFAEEADSLDLLFSEILYDVAADGAEFLEIYNNSARVIDLQGMEVASLRSGSDEIQNRASISVEPRLIFPGDYLALSAWPLRLSSFYDIKNPSALLQVPGMPLLSNEGGCAVLLTRGGKIIDKACWSDDMHHALLVNTQGIALERTSFEGSSLQTYNWHSAASLAGWATPGYENSQETETGIEDVRVRIVPELITPDNDGKDDYVSILFHMGEPGWTAQVQVYDMAGRLVRQLANNQLTGTEGLVNWDGQDDRGIPCYNGIYIIRVSMFNLKGDLFESKKVCVVSLY
jgi:hypothetical protein